MPPISPQDVPAENHQFSRFGDVVEIDPETNERKVISGAPATLAVAGSFVSLKSGAQSLPLDRLHCEPTTQARTGINPDVVAEYAEAMRNGAKFPPVIGYFDGKDGRGEVYIADGHHRTRAAKDAGETSIMVDVRQGSLEDAVWFAVKANATHGLRRTRADVQRAIKILLDHPKFCTLSDREIAAQVGCDHKTVGAARKGTGEIPQSVRTDKNGRTIDVSNIGKPPKAPSSGKPKAPEQGRADEPDTDDGSLTATADHELVAPLPAVDDEKLRLQEENDALRKRSLTGASFLDLQAEYQRRIDDLKARVVAHLETVEGGGRTFGPAVGISQGSLSKWIGGSLMLRPEILARIDAALSAEGSASATAA